MLVHYDPHEPYLPSPRADYGTGLRDRYMSEVSHTDHHLGELLSHLRRRPDYDDIAVLIVSDHGEELWDHGYVAHLLRLYDESVGVVLALRDPRRPEHPSPEHLRGPVSGIDVAPTVLELLGLPAPESMDGIPLGRRRRTAESPVFFHTLDRIGAATATRKIIYSRDTELLETYDLEADAAEQHNLARESPGTALLCEAMRRVGSR